MPNFGLARAEVQHQPYLREALNAYLRELSTMEGADAEAREALRRAGDRPLPYPWFDSYWKESGRFPFLIQMQEELAGFCFLRDAGTHWEIAEFYVLPGFRRRGAGAEAVRAVVDFCRSQSRHALLCADVLPWNTAALAFWQRQGFAIVSRDDQGFHTELRLDRQAV